MMSQQINKCDSNDESNESSENMNSNDSQVDEVNSSNDKSDEQAKMIASLLQNEHGEALHTPLDMPKPPTFPDKMADFLRSPSCKSIIVLAGAGMSVR